MKINLFLLLFSGPTITSVTPASPPSSGGIIQIQGDHYGNISSQVTVYITDAHSDRSPCTSVAIVTPNTLLSCTVPPGVGKNLFLFVTVGVATSAGTPFQYAGLSTTKIDHTVFKFSCLYRLKILLATLLLVSYNSPAYI